MEQFTDYIAAKLGHSNWVVSNRAKPPRGYEHCIPVSRAKYKELEAAWRRERFDKKVMETFAPLKGYPLTDPIVREAVVELMEWAQTPAALR